MMKRLAVVLVFLTIGFAVFGQSKEAVVGQLITEFEKNVDDTAVFWNKYKTDRAMDVSGVLPLFRKSNETLTKIRAETDGFKNNMTASHTSRLLVATEKLKSINDEITSTLNAAQETRQQSDSDIEKNLTDFERDVTGCVVLVDKYEKSGGKDAATLGETVVQVQKLTDLIDKFDVDKMSTAQKQRFSDSVNKLSAAATKLRALM
jgi:hypothetical protein